MTYILQTAHKTHCQTCDGEVALLCDGEPMNLRDFIWFYICFRCQKVSQVGVGPVEDFRDEVINPEQEKQKQKQTQTKQ